MYNEAHRLKSFSEKLSEYQKTTSLEIQYIAVCDGCTDQTVQRLSELKLPRPLEIVSYAHNRGKGGAVIEGLKHAKGEVVGFMDCDFSTSPFELERLPEHFKLGYDFIMANRMVNRKNHFSLTRSFASTIFRMLNSLALKHLYSDTQAGFKFFKSRYIEYFSKNMIIERYAFDVEMIYLCELSNLRVGYIEVEWKNDSDSKVRIIRDSARMAWDLMKIVLNKSYKDLRD